jgi:hypothetical protein
MTTKTRTLTAQSARALADRFRRHRHIGNGWNTMTDRDLAREGHELFMMSAAMRDRTH